jgi:hypothetical protein
MANAAFLDGCTVPLGTQVDDGSRVGPILTRSITNPQGYHPVPINQWGEGLLLSASNTYNIIPRGPSSAGNVSAANAYAAPGSVTLSGDGYIASKLVAGNGSNYLQLDWPRALSVTVATANMTAATNVTIYCRDYYGQNFQEVVTVNTVGTYQMKKAAYMFLGAYVNGTTGAGGTLSIQTTDVFGLPYRVDSAGDISNISWANQSDMTTTSPIAGSVIADMGVATISSGGTVTVNSPYVYPNSIIELTYSSDAGPAALPLVASTITEQTSFVITGDENQSVFWTVINNPYSTGTATLVAGTVTVYTSAIRADSNILLTAASAPEAGAPAATDYTYGTIVPGVSFTITATSGAATESVNWYIVNPSVLQGKATLTAGTVTIQSPAIKSTDLIMTTRRTSGGTIGFLSTVITPAVTGGATGSFVINSTSITDTSTVTWVIVSGNVSNAGSATLVSAGPPSAVTVANAGVNARSIVLLSRKTIAGTPGTIYAGAITAGTNFVINAKAASDNSVVNYLVVPASFDNPNRVVPLGTFTPADTSTPSNTTGDVRGTYKPSTAANGTNILHFSAFIHGFDNFENQQALSGSSINGNVMGLPAGGTAAAPLNRTPLNTNLQIGLTQYYTGTPA